ncbi:hypothetical protein B0H63DRAFT_104483 [Podospora didyma]|uniref:Uncharacterized protein n=1 Tax=Podospora didyma TaxID=330526 RepID=A0AAE0U413_9PEZI|nr:hypothetical protein B0H63DRAFT_104483 [Podospora didyma]
MPVDRRQRARQLIRFHTSGHPHTSVITSADLDFAWQLAWQLAPIFDPGDDYKEPDYPDSWSSSRHSLSGFLSNWRQWKREAALSQSNALNAPAETSTGPSTIGGAFSIEQPTSSSTPSTSTAAINLGLDLPRSGRELRREQLGSRHHHRQTSAPSLNPFGLDSTPNLSPFGLDSSLGFGSLNLNLDLDHEPLPQPNLFQQEAESHRLFRELNRPPSTGDTPVDTSPDSSVFIEHPNFPSIELPRNNSRDKPDDDEMAPNTVAGMTPQEITDIIARAVAEVHRNMPPPAPPPAPTAATSSLRPQNTFLHSATDYSTSLEQTAKLNIVLDAIDRELLETASIELVCRKLKDRFKLDYSDALKIMIAMERRATSTLSGKSTLLSKRSTLRSSSIFPVQTLLPH